MAGAVGHWLIQRLLSRPTLGAINGSVAETDSVMALERAVSSHDPVAELRMENGPLAINLGCNGPWSQCRALDCHEGVPLSIFEKNIRQVSAHVVGKQRRDGTPPGKHLISYIALFYFILSSHYHHLDASMCVYSGQI